MHICLPKMTSRKHKFIIVSGLGCRGALVSHFYSQYGQTLINRFVDEWMWLESQVFTRVFGV